MGPGSGSGLPGCESVIPAGPLLLPLLPLLLLPLLPLLLLPLLLLLLLLLLPLLPLLLLLLLPLLLLLLLLLPLPLLLLLLLPLPLLLPIVGRRRLGLAKEGRPEAEVDALMGAGAQGSGRVAVAAAVGGRETTGGSNTLDPRESRGSPREEDEEEEEEEERARED